MVAMLPIALAAVGYWGGRRAALLSIDRVPLERSESIPLPPPPMISLSIEPATGAMQPPERDAKVVIPGYLLPDDGPEEEVHAGD